MIYVNLTLAQAAKALNVINSFNYSYEHRPHMKIVSMDKEPKEYTLRVDDGGRTPLAFGIWRDDLGLPI